MSIAVRPVNLETDRGLLIDVLFQNLTPLSNGARFNWLYTEGPQGAARAWVAVGGDQKTVIGVAAAFPRRFCMGDREVSGWVLGDFCLDTGYRSLGPALKLQRVCLSVLENNKGVFCYDFPGASMLAVYKRLGVPIAGRMLRLAKLLRVDGKVSEIVSRPLVARTLSKLGNTVLRAMPVTRVSDPSIEISTHVGRCGEEFSILDREERSVLLDIRTQRSAEYLNWRYVDNPLARHEVLTVRRNGILKGYAVCTQVGEGASIVDLFGESDPSIVKGLLREIIDIFRNRNVMTLSVCLNEGHPWLPWYNEMGFYVRDWAPIVCVPARSFAGTMDMRNMKWFLMQGDRDS